MRKKQIFVILVIFVLLNVATLTFVIAKPNKVSRNLEEDLARIDAASINVLIETYNHDYTSIVAKIESLGGKVTHEFEYAKGLAAEVSYKAVMELKSLANVKKISKDEIRHISSTPTFGNEDLDEIFYNTEALSLEGREVQHLSSSQITKILDIVPETYWNFISMNAGPVWSSGYWGQGSLAVIIDTGVYDQHYMIQHAVIGGIDLSPDGGDPDWNSPDNHWHGTHCAGILAGDSGIIVPEDDILYQSYLYHTGISIPASDVIPGYEEGYYIIPLLGMAPEAEIFGIKVFPSTGEGVPTSWIIDAIEYAIWMHEYDGYDVDIISMSLGGGTGYDGRDLEAQTVDYASSIGITVVTSAGNEGPASLTVGSPGCANSVISVGATANPVNTRIFWDVAEYGVVGIGDLLFTSEVPQVIYFSSRGPTSDGRDKPDLCATGVFVLSAVTPGPGDLAWASGTSMACPAVAGAVAILNSWGDGVATPYDYKQALMEGAIWLDGYDIYDQGAGNLDAWNSFMYLVSNPLGDVHPPLPPPDPNSPVTPKGFDTGIVSSGTFSVDLVDLEPGFPVEFYFEATELTDYIEIKFSKLDMGIDLGLNSFEVSVQSAVRTGYDYFIESANVWGPALFKIKDFRTTWSGQISGVYYEEILIQPGYVKVCVENDWTSFDAISGELTITVKEGKPREQNANPFTPDELYAGTIETDDLIGWISVGVGKFGAYLELWWENDWNYYPTTDLDMAIAWVDIYDNVYYEFAAGGSLRCPEGVVIQGKEVAEIYVLIAGYETYTLVENWLLKVFYIQSESILLV